MRKRDSTAASLGPRRRPGYPSAPRQDSSRQSHHERSAGVLTTRAEKATFVGSGGDPLVGRLDLPDGEPLAYALFAHCFTCSKDVLAASRIARALVKQGIGVLRFDFTGLGASGGEFANTTFSSNVDDVVLAAEFLREHHRAP